MALNKPVGMPFAVTVLKPVTIAQPPVGPSATCVMVWLLLKALVKALKKAVGKLPERNE